MTNSADKSRALARFCGRRAVQKFGGVKQSRLAVRLAKQRPAGKNER